MTKKRKTSLSGRVRRYARVAGAGASTAARLAGKKYLGLSVDPAAHALSIARALGDLKGPVLKIAQLLATIPRALPDEYADALQQLQSNAPPMGWNFVRRRMASELGPDWQKKFKSFGQDAAAAASLGQVHRAVTAEGVEVACKLQYPDMLTAVDADLRQLKMVFSLFEGYDGAIMTDDIHQELAERLHEELDYRREARHTRLYAHILGEEAGVHVPCVLPDLSTDALLTATWLSGRGVMEFRKASAARRARIAVNLFRAWYLPLYGYGVLHGDPHPGNYTIREDDGINLLDFGCVRVFPPHFIEGVITLYRALQKNDDRLAAQAYESWGFKKLNRELIAALNTWARFLYGPVLDNRARAIGVVGKTVYGREVMQDVHHQLRRLGGVKPPREFVFMDRAALGLGSVFLHLNAEVNWYKIFNEFIEGFDVRSLARNQKTILARFDLS